MKRITTEQAAGMLGVPVLAVRDGMRLGQLKEIGFCIQIPNRQTRYIIWEEAVKQYIEKMGGGNGSENAS